MTCGLCHEKDDGDKMCTRENDVSEQGGSRERRGEKDK